MSRSPTRPRTSYSPESSPFLNEIRPAMRLRHMSRRTEASYLHYIVDFIRFHGKRHPQELRVGEIRAYLSYLATDKNVAASTQNVALAALFFLYRHVLHMDLPDIDNIERARRPLARLTQLIRCTNGTLPYLAAPASSKRLLGREPHWRPPSRSKHVRADVAQA